jgi:hypothetical protein
VWSIPDKALVKVLEGHTDTVFTVKISNDDQTIISGAADYTIRIWDMTSLEQIEKIETKGGMIESVALSKDDKYLVIGDRATKVHIWDWKERKMLKKFHHHTKWVKCVNFSADGNIFASASNDMTVRLWNCDEERHEMVLKGHTNTIRSVAFTNDGRYVVSAGEDLTVNIWNVADCGMMEMSDIGTSIDAYLFLTKIKTKVLPTSQNSQAVFSKLRVNLAHIYSYLGYDDLLKEALVQGTEVKIDEDGNSPLKYALMRNSQNCIDAILAYMIELKEQNMEQFLNYSHALRDDLNHLFTNHSVHLPNFIEAIFYTVPNLTNFAVPKQTLPILEYSEKKTLDVNVFVYELENSPPNEKEIPIEFKTLPFAISYNSGSSESKAMMESITTCPNRRILQTKFVRTFIQTKWNDIWWFILFLTLLMWINVLLMTALVVLSFLNYHQSLPGYTYFCGASFLLVNAILVFYEIVQAASTGSSYFYNFWNGVDMIRSILCFLWVILSAIFEQDDLYLVTWAMVVLNYFRGLTGFRAFDTTRYYTRLIIRAFAESISFILIFFYSTFAFGVIYFTSCQGKEQNIFRLWQNPYMLNMGDTGDIDQGNLMQYMYFMMASVINVIIMLNLLISILGDTFDSFQVEAAEIDSLEMAELILEIESLMYWKSDLNQKLYLHICKNLEVEGTGEWEGKVKEIFNMITRNRKAARDEYTVLNDKLNKIMTKLDIRR